MSSATKTFLSTSLLNAVFFFAVFLVTRPSELKFNVEPDPSDVRYLIVAQKKIPLSEPELPTVRISPLEKKYVLLPTSERSEVLSRKYDEAFFAGKRIAEMVTWASSLNVANTVHSTAELNQWWSINKPRPWKKESWNKYPYWESGLARYLEGMEKQLRKLNALPPNRTRYLRFSEFDKLLRLHQTKIEEALQTLNDGQKKEYLLHLEQLVFAQLRSQIPPRLNIPSVTQDVYVPEEVFLTKDFGVYVVEVPYFSQTKELYSKLQMLMNDSPVTLTATTSGFTSQSITLSSYDDVITLQNPEATREGELANYSPELRLHKIAVPISQTDRLQWTWKSYDQFSLSTEYLNVRQIQEVLQQVPWQWSRQAESVTSDTDESWTIENHFYLYALYFSILNLVLGGVYIGYLSLKVYLPKQIHDFDRRVEALLQQNVVWAFLQSLIASLGNSSGLFIALLRVFLLGLFSAGLFINILLIKSKYDFITIALFIVLLCLIILYKSAAASTLKLGLSIVILMPILSFIASTGFATRFGVWAFLFLATGMVQVMIEHYMTVQVRSLQQVLSELYKDFQAIKKCCVHILRLHKKPKIKKRQS